MSLRRVSFLLIVCVCGVTATAQECDELEGDDLTVCLTLMVCMALDEDRARNQCLEVARQVLDQRDAQKETSEKGETEAGVEAESIPEQVVVEEIPDQVEDTTREPDPIATEPGATKEKEATQELVVFEPEEEEAERGKRVGRWFSWMRRGGSRNAEEADEAEVGVTKDGVPKQFAATVVSVSKAGYNDALVVLSNRYVFIVSRARQSRIEPGDVIVARKKEGLSGRLSFLFYGRGASVDAHRVECGHVEPSRQTQRRCAFAARQLGVEPL